MKEKVIMKITCNVWSVEIFWFGDFSPKDQFLNICHPTFLDFYKSFCAVDLQLLTAVWYKSNKLFLNLENLPNSTKAQ